MASRRVIHKLHAVTLIHSGIGKPYWTKNSLKSLRLTKMHKTIVHKNIETVNGMLRAVKEHVRVVPIVLRADLANSPTGDEILLENGHFFLRRENWPEVDDDDLWSEGDGAQVRSEAGRAKLGSKIENAALGTVDETARDLKSNTPGSS